MLQLRDLKETSFQAVKRLCTPCSVTLLDWLSEVGLFRPRSPVNLGRSTSYFLSRTFSPFVCEGSQVTTVFEQTNTTRFGRHTGPVMAPLNTYAVRDEHSLIVLTNSKVSLAACSDNLLDTW